MKLYAYFPIEWDFPDRPGDGRGGPPVKDAGTLYLIADDDDDDEVGFGWTTLATLIAEIIEGSENNSGAIADIHVPSLIALRDALRAAADQLNERLEHPSIEQRLASLEGR